MAGIVTFVSFREYREHLRELLKGLRSELLFLFCVSCVERIVTLYGDALQSDYLPPERERISQIVEELRGSAAETRLLDGVRAQTIMVELENMGPADPVRMIEVQPDAIEIMCCLWNALDFCRSPNIDLALRASENIVNALDYNYSQTDREFLDLDTMFAMPLFKEECERQEAVISELLRRLSN